MARHAGGRPRRNTPAQVDAAIDGMIADYESTGEVRFLDDVELMRRLNVSPGTLERYYQGTADKAIERDRAEAAADNAKDNIYIHDDGERDTKESYAEALKKLIAYRRRVCVQHIATDRVSTGWIFLSKQPHWGGFQDVQRTETRGKQEITVTIAGPDGQPVRE